MTIKQLYFDQGICPKCKHNNVMYELECVDSTTRYCTKCDYEFYFIKKLMKD